MPKKPFLPAPAREKEEGKDRLVMRDPKVGKSVARDHYIERVSTARLRYPEEDHNKKEKYVSLDLFHEDSFCSYGGTG